MMDQYKNVISNSITKLYEQSLIIDVENDKIYRYVNKDGNFICDKESSYVDYFTECKNFIHEDDVQGYIESLSIAKLNESKNEITYNYRMMDEAVGGYMDYVNDISLYNQNGKNIIVVLVRRNSNINVFENSDNTKSELESKISKIINSVSIAMLKIHNVVNMDNELRTKDEFINSVLVGLTTEFPEFNKSFNDNAATVYSSGKSTIMIVDDDKLTCSLIGKIFANEYNVVTFGNGQEAIDYLNNNVDANISCIFLDLIMPVMDGFAVLDYLNNNNYLIKLPVIIISGNYDKETRKKAYSYQIADMLEKPFNAQVIRHRIENLISLYRSSGLLNEMMLEQHEDLKNVISSIVKSYELDNKIAMNMIRNYTKILAMQVSVEYPEYNISGNMINKLASSAMYYAIGNYTLPKSVLYKKVEYTNEEKDILQSANINGSAIIKYVVSNINDEIDSKYCYEITRYYNERFDGTGYPEGLKDESIPLSAQIASLAIEYANLINTIIPIDYNRVASLIKMESGYKFNPKIVDAFSNVQTEFEAITKVGV